ncbi:MAG TPA: xylose isomerase, partial [Kiloniellaceae bacterium]|nr:xylose isomerase [Kiloniellaceae bacterium]
RRIGRELERRAMTMGVIVNTAVYDRPSFVLDDRDERERLIREVRDTAEVARRVGATHVTTLSGTAHPSLPRDYQTAAMIENLKWAGEAAAEEGLVLALEPINHKGWPGTFVTDVGHAYLIAKAVGLPSVKLLYDFWHQQIHGGDLIANLELAWDEIAYVQIADNPGRGAPGTGEINYAAILQRLADKGFQGIVGLEFENPGPGKAGERAVIEAVRAVSPAVRQES